MEAPTLAAISMEATGGGVAMVARLLWDVLEHHWGTQARLMTLTRSRVRPSFREKTWYALRLAVTQAAGTTDWILYSHLGLAKPLAGIPRAWHKPYAIFLHGIEVWRPLTRGEQKVLAEAELRLANSDYTAARVMEMHPDIGPVVSCPLALPSLQPAPGNADLGPARSRLGPHVVLAVGRMFSSERYKGHDELIDAWPQVVAAVPDAQLVIVGQGDDRPRLQDKALRSPASRSIVFTGFVSSSTLAALYERAALFALPSRGEGFGLVYLEAMAHRLACVGSIHDAAREVIADGHTGRLVDRGNRGELAETLAALLIDEKRRLEMGLAGYARLTTEFSFNRFSMRLRDLLGVTPTAVAS